MKLVNFASLDPEQRARGIRGLGGHSRADEQVWKEFRTNWEQMTLVSEASLESLRMGKARTEEEVALRQSHEGPCDGGYAKRKDPNDAGFLSKGRPRRVRVEVLHYR